jgi:hypothetical protein
LSKIGFRADSGAYDPDRILTDAELGIPKRPATTTAPISGDGLGPNPGWGQPYGTPQGPMTGTVVTPTRNVTINAPITIQGMTGNSSDIRKTAFQVGQELRRVAGTA